MDKNIVTTGSKGIYFSYNRNNYKSIQTWNLADYYGMWCRGKKQIKMTPIFTTVKLYTLSEYDKACTVRCQTNMWKFSAMQNKLHSLLKKKLQNVTAGTKHGLDAMFSLHLGWLPTGTLQACYHSLVCLKLFWQHVKLQCWKHIFNFPCWKTDCSPLILECERRRRKEINRHKCLKN